MTSPVWAMPAVPSSRSGAAGQDAKTLFDATDLGYPCRVEAIPWAAYAASGRDEKPTSSAAPAVATNRLLGVLPDRDRRRIIANCELVELCADDVLYQAGTRLDDIYFPIGGYIALVTPVGASAGLEVALVGNEGMVGVAPLLGVSSSPLHHLVQGMGSALRMNVSSFRRELDRCSALRRRLNRYAYVAMNQIAQTVACTRFHLVEARLARWLLMTHDRSRSDRFRATHELLGHMLGVRRVGITKAATALQKQSLISYSRGDITILDRAGLETSACGCYVAANELYDRVLGSIGSANGDRLGVDR